MNLWQFYKDNPSLLETKIGDELAAIAAIVTGSSTKNALNVFVDGGSISSNSNGQPLFSSTKNIYSSALVPYATITTILSYTIVNSFFYIVDVIGWGDTNGEFLIKVDGIVKGGGRTTAASPNFLGEYEFAPIIASLGQVITITSEHYTTSTHEMKANLLGGIIS